MIHPSIGAQPSSGRRPRRATRIAPFVVLIALVSYALIVLALFTAPAKAKAMGPESVLVPQSAHSRVIDTSNNTAWTTPSMPPKCTDEQVAGGAVATCLVTKSFEPMARTWGTPPFPFVSGALSPGWKWLGWTTTVRRL